MGPAGEFNHVLRGRYDQAHEKPLCDSDLATTTIRYCESTVSCSVLLWVDEF